MTDFQRIIAKHRGVSLRTVRRLCATGKLPGVYRTRSGRYQLIGPCLKQLRQADERFRTASPETLKIYKATLKQQRRWLKELVDVLHASFVLNGETSALRPQRDDVPIKQLLHPSAIEAVERATGMLMIHAEKLRGQQIDTYVRPQSLARSLQISVSTFYKRYTLEQIRRACGCEHVETRVSRGRKVTAINFDEDFADKLADCRRW